MAEFEKAFTVGSLGEFVAGRVEKQRRWATERADGDAYLLRQAMYFHRAYLDCGCDSHTCTGCHITAAVHAQIEQLVVDFDPRRSDFELGRAGAIWDRVAREYADKVREIGERHLAMKQAKAPDPRAESIRRAQEAANA